MASVNGTLSVVDIGDQIDDGTNDPYPRFTISFAMPQTRFGFSFTDQFPPTPAMLFVVDFYSGIAKVDSFSVVAKSANLAVYLEALSTFDRVTIGNYYTAGWGIDNLTVESTVPTPEPPFCVSTSSELQNALTTASKNGKLIDVRVLRGCERWQIAFP